MPEKKRNVRSLDVRSLRGLAHPLRIQLLDALKIDGPATASQLAERLGESSGSTSYHLRQLATHGFVKDAPERGKGRERWWQAAYDGTMVERAEEFIEHPDPSVREAFAVLLHESASKHTRELNTWLSTMHEWPEAWRGVWDLSDWHLRMTPESARELGEKVRALIESYQDSEAESAEDFRFQVHAFPQRRGESSS